MAYAANRSPTVQGFRTIPAFIAGVILIAECIQQKLKAAKWSASAALRFSRLRLKAFVNRVNLLSCILMWRFWRRLVNRLASYLEYTLHEVPDAVLYEDGGATPEQCGELLDLLQELRSYVAVLHQEERYADLLADCELHFNSYRAYLAQQRAGDSYESFLEARGLGLGSG